jgi:hypothetical protein
MAEASGFTAVGLSGTDDALLIAAGVSSLPVSPALRAKRGIAATLMLSNTAANNRISFPPENEVLGLVFIDESVLE